MYSREYSALRPRAGGAALNMRAGIARARMARRATGNLIFLEFIVPRVMSCDPLYNMQLASTMSDSTRRPHLAVGGVGELCVEDVEPVLRRVARLVLVVVAARHRRSLAAPGAHDW